LISKVKFDFTPGKNALVTGGSSGIGLETSKKLIKEGMNIWVIARNNDRLQAAIEVLKAELILDSQIIEGIQADVTDFEKVQEIIRKIEINSGPVDLLINSAGTVKPGYFHELSLDEFHQMMSVNYFGTLHFIKAALPGMMNQGSGYIVNISSLGGIIGIFGYTAYSASKYAVRGFTDALRSELKPHNIGVSIVFPADTDTPQFEYENKYKPFETMYLNSKANLKAPEEIADIIIKGIKRGSYQIIPGGEPLLLYKVSNIIGAGRHIILDLLIQQAQKNNNNK
jgi:3-dehydrosphinganine reductase